MDFERIIPLILTMWTPLLPTFLQNKGIYKHIVELYKSLNT